MWKGVFELNWVYQAKIKFATIWFCANKYDLLVSHLTVEAAWICSLYLMDIYIKPIAVEYNFYFTIKLLVCLDSFV
jgi:hypothetical protein